MVQSAIPAAIAARDPAAMRAAIVGELVPVIPSNVDPQTWDPRELGTSGGNVWKAVIWQERIWYRDDTSVADHDEVTVIALLDGGRYLTNDVKFPGSVKSRAVTTPPDPLDADPGARPAYGEAWRVPAGASGAWSAHEDDVAMWSARGWQYKPAAIGDLHYVEDESVFEHFSAAAAWEDGIPFGVTASTIPQSALIWDNRVQNQTTNTPPSAAQGVAYIIGSSPTGAWAGHAGKIAIRESAGTSSTYVIYTPVLGQEVHDIALNNRMRWSGTAWIGADGSWIDRKSVFTSTGSITTPSSGVLSYTYSATVAPTSSVTKTTDDATLTFAAKASGNVLRLTYRASVKRDGNLGVTYGDIVVMLFRDNETSAADWALLNDEDDGYTISISFELTAIDTSSHTYIIAFSSNVLGGSFRYLVPSRRLFTIEESNQ